MLFSIFLFRSRFTVSRPVEAITKNIYLGTLCDNKDEGHFSFYEHRESHESLHLSLMSHYTSLLCAGACQSHATRDALY